MLSFFLQLDQDLFLFLNGLHHPWLDPVMIFFSGKFTQIPIYLVLLYLLIKYEGWESLRILLFVAILIAISDQLSVKAFKDVFERLRPCNEPGLQPYIHLVGGKCGGRFGFVSSHAANSFALAGFMGLLFRQQLPKLFIWLLLWAFVVSYSRIYLGVHYPGDIIGGGLLGVTVGWSIYQLYVLFRTKFCSNRCAG